MHEDLGRTHEVKNSSDRAFGIVFAIVFTGIGLWPLTFGGALHSWALIISAVFLVLALTWTAPLRPLNHLWTRFGLLMHAIVSPLVMGLLFFGTILPVSLLMRLAGKDSLNLRRDTSARTYWIERRPPGPRPETMMHQF